MSSTTRIPKAEITGLYGYLLKRFSRKCSVTSPSRPR